MVIEFLSPRERKRTSGDASKRVRRQPANHPRECLGHVVDMPGQLRISVEEACGAPIAGEVG
jgi:hypothetical protein